MPTDDRRVVPPVPPPPPPDEEVEVHDVVEETVVPPPTQPAAATAPARADAGQARTRPAIVLGIIGLVALIGLGLWWLWPKSEEAPVAQVPAAPVQVADPLVGEVVIVVDDTSSMDDTRPRLYAWYLAEIKEREGKVLDVVLYGGAGIRHFTPESVEFLGVGDLENTRAALESAAMGNTDVKSIVLISDEPGDDWGDWKLNLPPVVAHSLDPSADKALEYLAKITGGRFVGSKEVLARR